MPAYSNPSLGLSSDDVVPVALDTALDPVPTGLRIANKSAAWATLVFRTVDGGNNNRTLDIPPNSVITEAVRATQVLSAGTTNGLVIHGYQAN